MEPRVTTSLHDPQAQVGLPNIAKFKCVWLWSLLVTPHTAVPTGVMIHYSPWDLFLFLLLWLLLLQLHQSTRSELASIELGCLLLQTLSKWTASILTVPHSAQQIAQLHPWYMMVGVPSLSLYSLRFREVTLKEDSLKKGVWYIQGSKFCAPISGPPGRKRQSSLHLFLYALYSCHSAKKDTHHCFSSTP